MESKACKRCGVTKPIGEFRQYYNNRKGHYTYCKSCEKIEFRRKYLVGLTNRSEEQQSELDAINKLYGQRAAHGLSVPTAMQRSHGVTSIVADEMKQYE